VFWAVWTTLAGAQTWHPANQATVGWDQVTTMDNGQPLPAGDVVKYTVYLTQDMSKVTYDIVAEDIEVTQQILTFTSEGRYLWGASASRWVDGELVGMSAISWSDDPEAAEVPFGFVRFGAPADVRGLKLLGQ